jgi:hypothetical protein
MQSSTKRTRPLRGVNGEVCSEKDLTGSTLLEMSGLPTYQAWTSFVRGFTKNYFNFAYSAFAAMGMRMSESASFQSVRRS